MNVRGLYCETYPHWAHFGPQVYLATKLMWDVSTDAKAVMDEWLARMFGPAAEAMGEFYETLERIWMKRIPDGHWFHGLNNTLIHMLHFRPAERDVAWACLERAREAADSELISRRVNYVKQGFRFGYLMSRAFEDSRRLEQGDVEGAGRIVATIDETLGVYETAIAGDPDYPAPYYRGEKMEREFRWWKGFIGRQVARSLGETAVAATLTLSHCNRGTLEELLALAHDSELMAKIDHDVDRMTQKYGEGFLSW